MVTPASGQGAGPSASGESGVEPGFDTALRVTVPRDLAEVVGAALMEVLGPFELVDTRADQALGAAGKEQAVEKPVATLVFYPPEGVGLTTKEVAELLPAAGLKAGAVWVETVRVPRDWTEGWKEHFSPVVIGTVRVRPPWERAEETRLTDVVINPGLGFGTGLHPTTRGTLLLLQAARSRGPLVDVGTGSGILAIAAAKLGWAPVIALDNDPQALLSARENVAANGVEETVQVVETDLADAPLDWFAGATVLANLTLGPVLVLMERLCVAAEAGLWPRRLVVSGVLVGEQEERVRTRASLQGWACGGRIAEGEWVAQEFVPAGVVAGAAEDSSGTAAGAGEDG